MVVSILIASILAVVFMAARVTIARKTSTGGVIAVMLKTLASLGVIGIAVTAVYQGGITGNGIYIRSAIFVIAGLIMGLVGDVVLDLKTVYAKTQEEGVYLTSGMVSFGIGHIFYFVAMSLYFSSSIISWSVAGICIAVSAVLTFAIVFGGEKLLKLNYGKFTVHSVCYTFVLLTMTAISIALWVTAKGINGHIPLFSMGMILFMLSDLVLSEMYFGGRSKDGFLCIVNHTLYYTAQILIATFVFYM